MLNIFILYWNKFIHVENTGLSGTETRTAASGIEGKMPHAVWQIIVTVFTVVAGEACLARADVAAHELHAVAAVPTRVGLAGEFVGLICSVQTDPVVTTPLAIDTSYLSLRVL